MSAREKQAVLAHWLGQKKSTVREREEAKTELDKWFKRAKFALDAGEVELARAAKDRATEAREAYRKATARLIEIETELEKVRAEKIVPGLEEARAARARAEHAAGEFVKIGIEPKFAALVEGSRPISDAELDARPDVPTSQPSPEPSHASALEEAEALLDAEWADDEPTDPSAGDEP